MKNPCSIADEDLFEMIKPYTLVTPERLSNLLRLARDLDTREINGDVVECGTYKGGTAALLGSAMGDRSLWLYDSFEGLPETTEKDGAYAKRHVGDCKGTEKELREILEKAGVDGERCHIRAGWFQETFKLPLPERIALLHCDADWYESVLLTLETFFPRVVPGGFIILDDFGYFEGAREAFYEFCLRCGERPLLERRGITQAFWMKGRSHNRS
jgi:O-methyltransferase